MLVEFCSARVAGPFTVPPGRICSPKKTGVGCHWPALNIGTVSCALNSFSLSGKTGACPPIGDEEPTASTATLPAMTARPRIRKKKQAFYSPSNHPPRAPEPRKRALYLRQARSFELQLDGLFAHRALLGQADAIGRKHACEWVQEDACHAKLIGDQAGMLAACATKGVQHVVRHVVA